MANKLWCREKACTECENECDESVSNYCYLDCDGFIDETEYYSSECINCDSFNCMISDICEYELNICLNEYNENKILSAIKNDINELDYEKVFGIINTLRQNNELMV